MTASADRRLLLLLALVAAAAVAPCAVAAAAPAIAAPLLAWGSQPYFSAPASLQVLEDADAAVQRLLSSALQAGAPAEFASEWLDRAALEAAPPELLLVVLGSQLRSSDLSSRARATAVAPLREVLGRGGSGAAAADGSGAAAEPSSASLVLPYVLHQAGGGGDPSAARPHHEALQQQLSAAGVPSAAVQLVGCGGGSAAGAGADALTQALEAGSSGTSSSSSSPSPAVVIVCAGNAGSLEAELRQLSDAAAALAATGKRALGVYAARPDAAVLQQQQQQQQQQRRRLQAVGADVGTCGALCKTQVKWLEGILAAAILAFAAFSGMGCLYMLDTPTRFEKPKEV